MDTNIVPVTEAEMRGIAERLISTVVGYSRQSNELAELTKRVDDLTSQVSTLRGENATLRTERDDALAMAVENETKLNDARRHRDDLAQRVSTLTETVIARDSRVKDLEGLLTSAKLEAEDERRAKDYKQRQIDMLNTDIGMIRDRRNHYQERAETAEAALAEANEKLAAIQKQVSDVFGLVPQAKPEQAQEVLTKADPIQSTTTEAPAEAPKPWWELTDKAAQ